LKLLTTAKSIFNEFGVSGFRLLIAFIVARYLRRSGALDLTKVVATASVPASEPSLITVIVPTKDKLSYLKKCVGPLLAYAASGSINLIVIDNQSIEIETLNYLDAIGEIDNVEIFEFPFEFNYAKMMNFAVSKSREGILCFLNNDTEIRSFSDINKLAKLAQIDRIGAVGCLLTYADGRIQHAGVSIGTLGSAANYMRGHHVSELDNAGRNSVVEVPAVTGACLLVAKDKFLQVGGFSELFPIGLNDVDFCLELTSSGFTNVLDLATEVVHHESISRGLKVSLPQGLIEILRFRQKWFRQKRK
jgi:GT2 family glycosyltransferase